MKKYRVVYNSTGIISVMEDGEFTTASGDSMICDTLDNIRIMLTVLGINCDKLNEYN